MAARLKLFLLFALAGLAALPLKAYHYSNGADYSGAWSKADWADNVTGMRLGGSPGPSDDATIRGRVELDADLSLKSAVISMDSSVTARGRKIKITERLALDMANSRLLLKDCALEGPRNLEIYKLQSGIAQSSGEIVLENSSLSAGNMFVKHLRRASVPENVGALISLSGKSSLVLKGSLVSDPDFLEAGAPLFLAFKISAEGGRVPFVKIKGGQLGGVRLDVFAPEGLKKGNYPVFIAGKADYGGMFLRLNGAACKINEPVPLGKSRLTLEEASAPGDLGHGLILRVK